MFFCPAVSPTVSWGGQDVEKVLGAGRIVAVALSALRMAVWGGSVSGGRSGLVVAVVVRWGGWVQADGRPGEHARFGAVEEGLGSRWGSGMIDRIAAGVGPTGKVKARVRWEMSVVCMLRAVLLMALMPGADAREVLTTLWGDLVEVGWWWAHAVSSGTVLSTWRTVIGPQPMQELRRRVLAATIAEHSRPGRPGDGHCAEAPVLGGGAPGIEVGGGLRVEAIDETVTRMPDPRTNRETSGSAGQANTGYPQIPHLHVSDAVTRATLAVGTDPPGGDTTEAEQGLLDRARTEHPRVCTPNRLWIMDRDFPGAARTIAMLATASHVLIRVKSDIRLPRTGGFAPDGSSLATLSGGGTSLTVRVIEYHISLDGQTTPELFCLITDLLDHTTHPAHLLADASRWRWDGSETTLREAKSTIHGAGPDTGAILRPHHPNLIAQEHPAWITATELAHAATRTTTTRTAATRTEPFRTDPRTGQTVTARHLSFTTTRRTLITTARVTTDRHHHRHHKTKTRQAFSHTPHTTTTRTPPDRAPLHHHHRHDQHHHGLITDHRPTPRQPHSTIPGMEPSTPSQTAGPPP